MDFNFGQVSRNDFALLVSSFCSVTEALDVIVPKYDISSSFVVLLLRSLELQDQGWSSQNY